MGAQTDRWTRTNVLHNTHPLQSLTQCAVAYILAVIRFGGKVSPAMFDSTDLSHGTTSLLQTVLTYWQSMARIYLINDPKASKDLYLRYMGTNTKCIFTVRIIKAENLEAAFETLKTGCF